MQRLKCVLPDAVDDNCAYLIKMCSNLRLTSEIEIVCQITKQIGKQMVIFVPQECSLSESLQTHVEENSIEIRRK